MRKIIVTEFMTLDGVIEEPAWSTPYWNDEIARFKDGEYNAMGGHLLGRVTYQGFAAYWPKHPDEDGADQMNNPPKYVVSTTLERGEWQGTTIIRKDAAREIAALKELPGKDLLVAGSSILFQTLIQNDLVDEIHLLVYPILVGEGKHLFSDGIGNHDLHLLENKPMGSGVLLLIYGPKGK
jgi:dihydrofolate reductase